MLAPGSRLGPYEVISLLGEGGMGQVYRARDSRLGRDVALKIISVGRSIDADQQRRFEQEARAAAALNHPGIIAVHDAGAHDGVPYIVSELLEGATLRERLVDGPLPARKATEYATQMARALAAAHERGIVHRDLKPENVFVVKDGRVKILDFGLAKLVVDGGKTALDRTVTADAGTTPGTVMGTVGYMSPEQVRGDAVDHRSDIFALGAILYEMLTGRRAFHGRTPADTMTAVLREDPAPVPPGGNAALERIVGFCLEKDPALRLQSAQDVALALEAMSGSSTALHPPAATPSPRWSWRSVAAALAVLGAVGLGGYSAGRLRVPQRDLPGFSRLTFHGGLVSVARFAPDQSAVIYSSTRPGSGALERLYEVRRGTSESAAIGSDSMRLADVSVNGELAVLSHVRSSPNPFVFIGTLGRMPASGGAARDLLEGVEAAAWAPDGTSLAAVRTVGGRSRLEYPLGTAVFETSGWIDAVRVSADGRAIAFAEHPLSGDDRGWINVLEIASKSVQRRTPELTSVRGIAWHPATGEIYYGTSTRIEALAANGPPRVIARSTELPYLSDIGRDGRLLVNYITMEARLRLQQPSGEQRDLQWLDGTIPIAFWPTGDRLLFWEGNRYGVYYRALDGAPAVRIGDGTPVALSPDGRRALAIQHTEPMRLAVYPTGAGDTQILETPGIQTIYSGAWTSDGRHVVFAGAERDQPVRVYKMALDDAAPVAIGPAGVTLQRFSSLVTPDNTFVLATGADGKFLLVPLGGGEVQPANGLRTDDFALGWEPDGRTMLVAESGREWPVKMVKVNVITGDRALWKTALSMTDAPRSGFANMIVSADRRLVAAGSVQIRSTLHAVSLEAPRP